MAYCAETSAEKVEDLDMSRFSPQMREEVAHWKEALPYVGEPKHATPLPIWNWLMVRMKARRVLQFRKPEEWVAEIARIEDRDERVTIARIVWWDFFSSRPVTERWPHLDEYLAPCPTRELEKERIAELLYSVGYTAGMAVRRAIARDDIE